MDRVLLSLLGLYGFRLSRRSTATIERLGAQAAGGDQSAAHHFTQTRYARALGPRNSDLGMVFYGLVLFTGVTGSFRRGLVSRGLYWGSAFSVGLSVYLLWALFVRLRVVCPVCLRGHATNLLTFLVLTRARARARLD